MFKSQLEVAWASKDAVAEVRAYDNLSVTYYYSGNLTASQYYYHRMYNTITEPPESPYRKVYATWEKRYNKQFESEKRGVEVNRLVTLRPYPALVASEEELKEYLTARVKLCTLGDETPRVLPDDPWKPEGEKSLPSPRTESLYTENAFVSEMSERSESIVKDKSRTVAFAVLVDIEINADCGGKKQISSPINLYEPFKQIKEFKVC
eukprot:TRINITY_DN9496_c0_g1_i6.p2 TRINITY_DN9496_c0_g1~~TRINITY_DN9496_c0_g1_i6.p2  ORF type:complete len:207 (-),score=62.37 TRINITY_DN9496_c0_g1_i6:243-863(-)